MLKNQIRILVISLFLMLTSCGYDDGFRVENDKVVYERPWNTGHFTQIVDVDVDADAETFETLGGHNMVWARDMTYIFNDHHKLDFLDRDTFEVLNEDYGKDNNTVVCGIKPVKDVDVDSFKLKKFSVGFGKKMVLGIDKNAAYLRVCGSRKL
jgi:hypothetical protein